MSKHCCSKSIREGSSFTELRECFVVDLDSDDFGWIRDIWSKRNSLVNEAFSDWQCVCSF